MLLACSNETDKLAENNPIDISQTSLPNINYIAPQDNRFSEQQLVAFINIKKREAELLNSRSSASDQSYPEIETTAIMDLEFNVKEYLWIKNIIIETGTRVMLSNFYEKNKKIVSLLEKALLRYESKKLKLTNLEERRIITDYIMEIKGQLAPLKEKINSYTTHSAAMQHNMSLYEKHKEQLDLIF